MLQKTARPTYDADLGETYLIIEWDTLVHMAGHFGSWGLTVQYLGPKCLLDTSVLVLNVRTLRTHLNSAEVSQCPTVSGPKCPVTSLTAVNHSLEIGSQ